MPRNRSEKHDPVRTYLMYRYLLLSDWGGYHATEAKAWKALTEEQQSTVRLQEWSENNRIGEAAYDATKPK